MALSRLSIHSLRNILTAQLHPNPAINVIYGANGSGKSSVLEALHVLGMGRAFKVSRNRNLIHYDRNELTVFGQTVKGQHDIGVSRHSETGLKIRINGEDIHRSAELANMLPISLINSETFLLLEGSPGNRRAFLDWGAFHFDQGFIYHWQQAQKCIKNRNILLRSGKLDRSQLAIWDQAFIAASEQVDKIRQRYLEGFVPVFSEVLNKLCDLPDLTLVYRRGWDKTKTLAEVLQDQLPRDIKTGYSHAGPQRADISIRLNGHPAHEVLSRGQQKLVVSAMKIAQGFYLSELKKSDFVFLVDDLPSELDSTHQQQLCQLLEELKAQVFITSIDPLLAPELWQDADAVTHFLVDNGQITEQSRKPSFIEDDKAADDVSGRQRELS